MGCQTPHLAVCSLITLQAGLSQVLAGVTVRLPAGLRLVHTSELSVLKRQRSSVSREVFGTDIYVASTY